MLIFGDVATTRQRGYPADRLRHLSAGKDGGLIYASSQLKSLQDTKCSNDRYKAIVKI